MFFLDLLFSVYRYFSRTIHLLFCHDMYRYLRVCSNFVYTRVFMEVSYVKSTCSKRQCYVCLCIYSLRTHMYFSVLLKCLTDRFLSSSKGQRVLK